MKKTLYVKLLLAYVIFAVFGLIVVATFMQQIALPIYFPKTTALTFIRTDHP